MEVNVFVHLRLFPRQKNGSIDNGKPVTPSTYIECPVCHQKTMIESVSLEYCGNCGNVETDYWGLTNG